MSKEKEIGLTKLITILFLTIVMAAAFMPMTSFGAVSDEASDTKTVKEYPDSCSNTEVSLIKTSYLESIDGGYMRVFNKDSKVHVEYYDSDFKVTGKKSIKLELPIWGGFFKGEDAYYLVEGQNNKKGVDGTEVVRIIKYDTSWKRIGAGSVYAKEGWEYEIRYPFDYSNVNFTETGGNLYLITGREGYVDPQFGMGHQGMMLIRMNESTLNTEIVYGDFWHSFSQHITHNGSDVYLYEESEGNRATQLSLFDGNSTGTDYFDA
ncbi:MAG: hypothetical protein PUB39_07395 [Eubacteriales bacterium]|nr:hypothetical protein [Eubacteriales bacterium]